MRVTMHYQVSAMTIDYFRQSRCPKEWVYLWNFSTNGFKDRRIVQHDYTLVGAELRHRTLQLKRLLNRCPYKSFDFLLTKSSKHPAAESSDKTFGAGKSDSVFFIA